MCGVASIGFHKVQTHCIVGRRLCCLGVSQVTCKKPAPPSAWQICMGGLWKLWQRETGADGQTNRLKDERHSSPLSCHKREVDVKLTLLAANNKQFKVVHNYTEQPWTTIPVYEVLKAGYSRKQTCWWYTLTACIRVNYGNGMQSSAWCHLTRQKHLNTPSISLSGKQRGHLGWVGLWVFWQEQSRRNLVTPQRHPTVCSTERQVDMPPQNLPG